MLEQTRAARIRNHLREIIVHILYLLVPVDFALFNDAHLDSLPPSAQRVRIMYIRSLCTCKMSHLQRSH